MIQKTYGNEAGFDEEFERQFLSIFAVFKDLDAGDYTVKLYARAVGSNPYQVNSIDFGDSITDGKVICKETF